jgi:hypothetical protein
LKISAKISLSKKFINPGRDATIGGYGAMKREPTKQELIGQLTQLRAEYEQIRKRTKEIGVKTSTLYRAIERVAEPPRGTAVSEQHESADIRALLQELVESTNKAVQSHAAGLRRHEKGLVGTPKKLPICGKRALGSPPCSNLTPKVCECIKPPSSLYSK